MQPAKAVDVARRGSRRRSLGRLDSESAPGPTDQKPRFRSILDPLAADEQASPIPEPDYFADLHLGDIVRAITRGRDEYELEGFFRVLCTDVAMIEYRHAVFRDLHDPDVLRALTSFSTGMHRMRARLAMSKSGHYRYEKERWFVDGVQAYCDAVAELAEDLHDLRIRSAGLLGLRDYLGHYIHGTRFPELSASVRRVREELSALVFGLRIGAGQLTVTRYDGEPDYGAEVLATFEKFRQGSDKEYAFKFGTSREINHIESAVVDRVALLHPEPFAGLDRFYAIQQGFADSTVVRFAREIQFYLAYLDFAGSFESRGLQFGYPQFKTAGECYARGLFDMALAQSLGDAAAPITNDFELHGGQRVLVVTGPNQGGKTTFARSIGQLHHFAALGVPVPAAAAQVPLVDAIFAHFERTEQVEDLAGKLEDDLRRMKLILGGASAHSLIVMNESFSSTTAEDQLVISSAVLRQIIECGAICVLVTFLGELAAFGPSVVSMVAGVDPADPARRTYRIEGRPADGRAYALALARKRGLDYAQIRGRLTR